MRMLELWFGSWQFQDGSGGMDFGWPFAETYKRELDAYIAERVTQVLAERAESIPASAIEGPSGEDRRKGSAKSTFPMTTTQAAERLGVSDDTLRRWIKDLDIVPPRTRGGHYRVNEEIFRRLQKEFGRGARYR